MAGTAGPRSREGLLQAGDFIECELEKIGILSNRVVESPLL
jgi:2-keto-4-pentenoate hydratase/2-oxohepta-3-ene-1,7-dioic acid hydratase in catechol pathway